MKLAEVRAYGKLWQSRLKLLDWDVQYRWMTKAESLEMSDCNGFCQWSEQHRSAVIAISKDSESIPRTVIHELGHLRIEGHLPCSGETNIPLEVAINALTEALLKLEGVHA
jgi:Zn-dependent peptidase ImmA (M78 family)